MKKILNLIIIDLKNLTYNWVFYVLPVMAIVIILLINFVIPEKVHVFDQEVIVYEKDGNTLTQSIRAAMKYVDNITYTFAESESALEKLVAAKSNRMGLIMEGGIRNPTFTLLHQGTEAESLKLYMAATTDLWMREVRSFRIFMEDFHFPAGYRLLVYDENMEEYKDKYAETPFTAYLLNMGLITRADISLSLSALESAEKETAQSYGLIVKAGYARPGYRLLYTKADSTELRRIEQSLARIKTRLAEIFPPNYVITAAREQAKPVPFNQSLVPLFMIFEVGMLGIFLSLFMLFQEKEEKTLQAYRITPGGAGSYLAARLILTTLLSALYAFVITFFTVGLTVNYLHVLIVSMLTSLLFTLTGLIIALFFKSITEAIWIIVFLVLIFSLPPISYFNPSFSPLVLRLIPSYPIIFGYREIFFPGGKAGFMEPLLIELCLECLVLVGIGYLCVKNVLMKEGRRKKW